MDTSKSSTNFHLIVGAGLTGLYLGYRLKQLNKPYMIIEQLDRVGGRVYSHMFHDVELNMGAGVIREQDNHILKLVKELGLEVGEVIDNITFDGLDNGYAELSESSESSEESSESSEESSDEESESTEESESSDDSSSSSSSSSESISLTSVDMTIQRINEQLLDYRSLADTFTDMSFAVYSQLILDNEDYLFLKRYITHGDAWTGSAKWVIDQYPLNEVVMHGYHKFMYLKKGWSSLINKLKTINADAIKISHQIVKIHPNYVDVIAGGSSIKINYDKLILTGRKDQLLKLNIPSQIAYTINQISGTSFVRLYTYHHQKIPNVFVRCDNMLSKIISYSDHILMASYSESKDADDIHTMLKKVDKITGLQFINQLLFKVQPYFINNPAIDYYYQHWPVGVHYYNNAVGYLPVVQEGNIFVCGEVVSAIQGWTDGAIFSADKLLDYLFK